ncbi:hypothetical protein DPMN_035734 [Dreissena polymorpha]|uniref:Calcium uniporter protein n=1 Tax=Dreissena polymorpha TaxID=45954 RepID=A0A9D4MBK0_DREPO|nr:hypothetical protein DPMN_035734 [Dreissena polymorpha]
MENSPDLCFLSFSDVSVKYRHGLSVFAVPLPSRKESCEIVLKPVSHTVKDLVNFIKEEDKGIDRVAVYRASKFRKEIEPCAGKTVFLSLCLK